MPWEAWVHNELVEQVIADVAVAEQLVQTFSDSWTSFDRMSETITDFMRRSLGVSQDATVSEIDHKASPVLDAIFAIRKSLIAADLFYEPLQGKFNAACAAFTFGMRTLHNEAIAMRLMSDPVEDIPSFVNLVTRQVTTDVAHQQDRDRDFRIGSKDSTPFQQLLCVVLDLLWEHGYRRAGVRCSNIAKNSETPTNYNLTGRSTNLSLTLILKSTVALNQDHDRRRVPQRRSPRRLQQLRR